MLSGGLTGAHTYAGVWSQGKFRVSATPVLTVKSKETELDHILQGPRNKTPSPKGLNPAGYKNGARGQSQVENKGRQSKKVDASGTGVSKTFTDVH